MNRPLLLAAALAAAALAVPAQAVQLEARFSGTVQAQVDSGFALNDALSGRFVFDTDSGRFLSFSIGDRAVAPGFSSTAATTPDRYTALYTAQVSPVAVPGASNSTFVLDLEGLAPWASTDAVALLQDRSQLAANLDTSLSRFAFFTANADGSNQHSVDAVLGSLSVSAVPEPGTLLMMALGLGGLLAAGRRRQG